jgi:capsid protein
MTDHADLIARLLGTVASEETRRRAAAAIKALVNDVRVLKADLDRSEDNVSRLIAERDEARALLREARVFVKHLWNDSEAQKLLARIDALLAKTEGMT